MTATYTYDGDGRRVKKVVNGVATIFHYDEGGQLIAESNGSGTVTAVYVYLNGQPLAKIEGASVYYYHNDALGTPQKMTDSTGTVVWSADYKPFGEATITVSTITNNLRFPGQYYDAETGTHYNYFRDYDPTTGRYKQADPWYSGIVRMSSSRAKVDVRIRRPGRLVDLSLYPYVENNPLKWIDPRGLEIFIVGGRGPFTFRYGPRFNRMPRVPDPRACRVPRTTPEPAPPTPEFGPPTPNPAPTSPWAEFWQNVADLLDELSSGPPTTPYDPIYGDLGA